MKLDHNQEYLKERLDYCPASGIMRWKARSEKDIPTAKVRNAWNTQYAGQPVGSVCKTTGYRKAYIGNSVLGRRNCYVHRLIWTWMTGEVPDVMDHIDRDRTNNRWDNLRDTDYIVNSHNSGLSGLNKSGVKGVHYAKQTGLWIAQMKIGSKTVHLGSSKSFDEALAFREAAELEHRNYD